VLHRYEVGDRVKVVRVRPDDSAEVKVGDVGTMVTPNRKDTEQHALYDHEVSFGERKVEFLYDDEIELLNEEAK
jgi:hypothetical protein